jgi:hypothetical protein
MAGRRALRPLERAIPPAGRGTLGGAAFRTLLDGRSEPGRDRHIGA